MILSLLFIIFIFISVMVDIVDSDIQDRVSNRIPENHSKSRLTLSKRMEHPSLNSTKYFLEDLNKQSPTFSPLNSVKNKKNMFNDSSIDKKKLQEKPNIKLNQFESSQNDAVGDRYKNRYPLSRDIPPISKHYQFSPYSQNGVLRKARHSSYFNGKQNVSVFNQSSYLKQLEPSFIDENSKFRDTNLSYHQNQNPGKMNVMRQKYREVQKQNQQLKDIIGQLKKQLKMNKQRQSELQRLLLTIRRECGQNVFSNEGCSNFIKRWQRNDSFVSSIVDMRAKITGKTENNLRDVWRWLKHIVQDLNSKRQITDWVKEQYLRIPKQQPDEAIRSKLEKIRR